MAQILGFIPGSQKEIKFLRYDKNLDARAVLFSLRTCAAAQSISVRAVHSRTR